MSSSLYHFKCRAECLQDVIDFQCKMLESVAQDMELFREKKQTDYFSIPFFLWKQDEIFPDCVLEFSMKMETSQEENKEAIRRGINEIFKILKSIPDLHVMEETLQWRDCYDGGRDSGRRLELLETISK